MARRTTLSLLALFLAPLGTSAAFAQVQPAWNVQYRHAPRPFVSPVEVLPLPDGGVVTVGLGFSSANRRADADVVVAAFDEYGENTWTWSTQAAPDTSTSLLFEPVASAGMDADGNVYVAYTRLNRSDIVSLDVDGAVRWQERLIQPPSSVGSAATCIDVTPAGDVRVAAFGLHSTWPIMEIEAFNATGTRTWTWSGGFIQGTPGMPHGVRIAPGGETYVYGQNDGTGFAPYHKSYVLLLDATGQLVWYNDQVTNAGQLAYRYGDVDSNGDLVVAYTGWVSNWPSSDSAASLRRYGLNGAVQSSASLRDYLPDCCGAIRDLQVAPSGDTYMAFDGLDQVVRVAPTGALLPEWTLPIPGAEILAIQPTVDGGAIVTAARGPVGTSGTVDASFDASGTVAWLQERPGETPAGLDELFPSRTDMDVAIGARGNIFVSNTTRDQLTPGQRTGITKLIEGPPVGTNYCGPAPVNSTGVPASLRGLGSDVRGEDNLSLLISDLPIGAFVLFLASPQAGFVMNPGGSQGNLCLGGHIGRYMGANQLRRARQNGTAYLQLDLDVIPRPLMFLSASVGESWNFQAMYRDVVGGMATSNFSDGIGVLMR